MAIDGGRVSTAKFVTDFSEYPLSLVDGGVLEPLGVPGKVYVSATSATGVGAVLGAGPMFSIPDAPAALEPLEGFNQLAFGTRFAWAPTIDAMHLLVLNPPSATGAPHISIRTDSTSVVLPDLAADGVTLPASSNYKWEVFSTSDFPNVDRFLTTDGSNFGSRFTLTKSRNSQTPD